MKIWELFSEYEYLREEGKIIPNVNTTVDVQPGETQRQAAKMGFSLDAMGCPPTFRKGASAFTNAKDTVNGGDDWYGKDGTRLRESLDEIRTIEPFNAGTDSDNLKRLEFWTHEGIPQQVGEIKDWTIHCSDWPKGVDDMPRFYFLDAKGKTVGSARLSAIDLTKNHYKVGHIWLNPMYQGKGYGMAFYCWLIEQGVILDADYDQTPASQKIWKGLAKKYKVRMHKGDWQSGPLTDVSAAWDSDASWIGLRASKT